MTDNRSQSVALGVATRNARRLRQNRAQILAPILPSLFTFIAFTGALSALTRTRGFNYYNFTAFEFVFILFSAATTAGAFSSFDVLFDFQGGMGRRMMLAAPQRLAILVGYLIVALFRGVLAIVVIWLAALVIGMPVRGGPLDVLALCVLALLLNLAAYFYGLGVGLRLQAMAAATLIFIPTFMVMFLTPVFAPRGDLSGWLNTAATVNPLTAPVEAGRGLLANAPVSVALAFAVSLGLVILSAIWAVRGMRAAERKG